jgi:hypothetical protein
LFRGLYYDNQETIVAKPKNPMVSYCPAPMGRETITVAFPGEAPVKKRGTTARILFDQIAVNGRGFGPLRRIGTGGWQRRYRLPENLGSARAIEKHFPRRTKAK